MQVNNIKKAKWVDAELIAKSINIICDRYPVIEEAYKHILEFRNIYEQRSREKATEKFTRWINKTNEQKI